MADVHGGGPGQTPTGNSLEFSQKQLEEAYEAAQAEMGTARREAGRRELGAYSLKGIAVFGGIAVAAGLTGLGVHVVGIAIAVAVALDRMSENHVRLISVTDGKNAYRRLLAKVRREHSRDLGTLMPKKASDPNGFTDDLTKLNLSAALEINVGRDIIATAMEAVDLKALRSLAPDEGTGKGSQP